MATTINIDRFTRLKQSIEGKFAPHALPGLVEYLAGEGGEIHYSMEGYAAVDLTGSQERRVKCIIYGWFLLFDPLTLAVFTYKFNINSSLILVADESALPPLEMESETEDFIVCGAEMVVAERVEEEILLNLPPNAVKRNGKFDSREGRIFSGTMNSAMSPAASKTPLDVDKKISHFAKLAELKKK